MADTELLNSCRMYFRESQQSWKVYFSKWEALAKEEEVEAYSLCENSANEFRPSVKQKKRTSICRKIRNKSIAVLNKKESKGSNLLHNRKLKEKKKSHGKNLVRKSNIEIMDKTENEANLRSEMLNSKYSEPDLKAIFIEILSENARNNEMFTVLSRMFSKNIDSVGKFSFNSMLIEKNELVGNLSNNVNSELSYLNKISSRRSSNNKIELKCDPCESVRFLGASQTSISDFKQSDYFESRERHGNENQSLYIHKNCFETNSESTFGNNMYSFNVNRHIIKKNFAEVQVNLRNVQLSKKLFPNENDENEFTHIAKEIGVKTQQQSFGNVEKEANSSFSRKFMLNKSNSYLKNGQYLGGCYNTMSLCLSDCSENSGDNFKIRERLSFESYSTVFNKVRNSGPTFATSMKQCTVENRPRKSKRSRSSDLFHFSDDSDDDEKNKNNKNPSKFLKIYCTPKRSKQLIKKENENCQKAASVSDDEDFTILDRTKTNEN